MTRNESSRELERHPSDLPSRRGPLRGLRRTFGTPSGKVLAIVPAVLTLTIGVVAGEELAGSSTSPGPGSPPSHSAPPATPAQQSSPPAAPTPSAASTVSPAASTGGAGAGAGAIGSGTVYLAHLAPVSGSFHSGDTNPVVNGKSQLLPVAQDIGFDSSTGIVSNSDVVNSGDIQYNLGKHYTMLTGLLGVDDSSADAKLNPTVEIEGDGLKLATFTPTLGHPIHLNVNVSGVLRLDFNWSDPSITPSSPSNNTIMGTWLIGNGQLTAVTGYQPSPSPSAAG